MNFLVIFSSKKLENYFHIYFDCGNGIGHTSHNVIYIYGQIKQQLDNWPVTKNAPSI